LIRQTLSDKIEIESPLHPIAEVRLIGW